MHDAYCTTSNIIQMISSQPFISEYVQSNKTNLIGKIPFNALPNS